MDDQNNRDADGAADNTKMSKTVKFIVGKGFYIVLFLCLAAIGISGYVIFSAGQGPSGKPDFTGIGLLTTVPYSGVDVTATAPEKPVGTQTMIPDSTTTKEPPTTNPPGTGTTKLFYVRPVVGTLMREYSGTVPVFNPTMDDWRVHTGIDIAADLGEPVCSVAAGVVSAIYRDDFKGTIVEIEHLDGRTSRYCGLMQNPVVSVGKSVTAGTIIGAIGDTAIFETLDAPHLHFELLANGKYLDPLTILPNSAN